MMTRCFSLLIAWLVAGSFFIPFDVAAQSREEKIDELMRLQQWDAVFKRMERATFESLKPFLEAIVNGTIADAKKRTTLSAQQEAEMLSLVQSTRITIDVASLTALIRKSFVEFSDQEIDGLLRFYRTPLAKKATEIGLRTTDQMEPLLLQEQPKIVERAVADLAKALEGHSAKLR